MIPDPITGTLNSMKSIDIAGYGLIVSVTRTLGAVAGELKIFFCGGPICQTFPLSTSIKTEFHAIVSAPSKYWLYVWPADGSDRKRGINRAGKSFFIGDVLVSSLKV